MSEQLKKIAEHISKGKTLFVIGELVRTNSNPTEKKPELLIHYLAKEKTNIHCLNENQKQTIQEEYRHDGIYNTFNNFHKKIHKDFLILDIGNLDPLNNNNNCEDSVKNLSKQILTTGSDVDIYNKLYNIYSQIKTQIKDNRVSSFIFIGCDYNELMLRNIIAFIVSCFKKDNNKASFWNNIELLHFVEFSNELKEFINNNNYMNDKRIESLTDVERYLNSIADEIDIPPEDKIRNSEKLIINHSDIAGTIEKQLELLKSKNDSNYQSICYMKDKDFIDSFNGITGKQDLKKLIETKKIVVVYLSEGYDSVLFHNNEKETEYRTNIFQRILDWCQYEIYNKDDPKKRRVRVLEMGELKPDIYRLNGYIAGESNEKSIIIKFVELPVALNSEETVIKFEENSFINYPLGIPDKISIEEKDCLNEKNKKAYEYIKKLFNHENTLYDNKKEGKLTENTFGYISNSIHFISVITKVSLSIFKWYAEKGNELPYGNWFIQEWIFAAQMHNINEDFYFSIILAEVDESEFKEVFNRIKILCLRVNPNEFLYYKLKMIEPIGFERGEKDQETIFKKIER